MMIDITPVISKRTIMKTDHKFHSNNIKISNNYKEKIINKQKIHKTTIHMINNDNNKTF